MATGRPPLPSETPRTSVSTGRMTLCLASVVAFVFLAGFDRVPADRRWEAMMVEGQYGQVTLNRDDEVWPPLANDRIRSEIRSAAGTRYGIVVGDKEKDSFSGLLPGEGWFLRGGLLSRIDLADEQVELFGKLAIRTRGTTDYRKDMWADLFLVRRAKGGGAGVVIRKWTFNPGDIVVTVRPGNPYGGVDIPEYTIGGALRHEIATNEIEVTLQGITKPVVERVSLTRPR